MRSRQKEEKKIDKKKESRMENKRTEQGKKTN